MTGENFPDRNLIPWTRRVHRIKTTEGRRRHLGNDPPQSGASADGVRFPQLGNRRMINGRAPDRLKCRSDRPFDKRGAGLLQLPGSCQDGLDVNHLDPPPQPANNRRDCTARPP